MLSGQRLAFHTAVNVIHSDTGIERKPSRHHDGAISQAHDGGDRALRGARTSGQLRGRIQERRRWVSRCSTRIDSQDPTALIGLPLIWLCGRTPAKRLRVPLIRPRCLRDADVVLLKLASSTDCNSSGNGAVTVNGFVGPARSKRQRMRVQKHAIQTITASAAASCSRSPYFSSPAIGMARMRGMHANLMRSTGSDFDVDISVASFAKCCERLEGRYRVLTFAGARARRARRPA